MYYEINVSLKGTHFFATHERSLKDLDSAKKLFKLFARKFPAKDGYHITMMRVELRGEVVDVDLLGVA